MRAAQWARARRHDCSLSTHIAASFPAPQVRVLDVLSKDNITCVEGGGKLLEGRFFKRLFVLFFSSSRASCATRVDVSSLPFFFSPVLLPPPPPSAHARRLP